MEKGGRLEDFDDESIFKQSQSLALTDSTLNFAVEFGKDKAGIAFDLTEQEVRSLITADITAETPVRWINIWGPNKQVDIIELLGRHYSFSPRLLAVMKTAPPYSEPRIEDSFHKRRPKSIDKDDVELASASLDTPRTGPAIHIGHAPSHYDIAKQILHFQSIDVGSHYLCLGANWMHERSSAGAEFNIDAESKRRPLWSWLILCDDHTVLSLHEDVGTVHSKIDLQSMRNNTLSVLSQLSNHGHFRADPISMQSVRQALQLESSLGDQGLEGASNLFYYLFDDWRAVFETSAAYRQRLKELEVEILGDMTRKSYRAPNIEIIPRLHLLGREIRQMQHLYEGYKNLIQRILEPRTGAARHGNNTPRSLSNLTGVRGVVVADSALTRFERLTDRITLLILSETQEFLEEKEALINTYFNINAQKDSESTARLTRSATLLAKLSVVFLPVSLMTSYFSVQIPELANKYSAKDYWYSFAVIMSLSFLGLFFFARLLMYITELLDGWIKQIGRRLTELIMRGFGQVKRPRT